jgi:hypothetical protein
MNEPLPSSSKEIFCQSCEMNCPSRSWSSHLRSKLHKDNTSSKRENGVDVISSAFKERIISYRIHALEFYINIISFLNDYTPKIIRLIQHELQRHTCVKLNLELYGFYYCKKMDVYEVKSFNTQFQVVCQGSDLEEILNQFYAVMDKKADELAERESGMVYLLKVLKTWNYLQNDNFSLLTVSNFTIFFVTEWQLIKVLYV